MRRSLSMLLGFLFILSLGLAPAVTAQDPSPTAGEALAGLGLPTMDITVTASGYEGVPETVEAGRYLVNVTAADDTAEMGGGSIGFIQPAGMTGDEFVAFFQQLSGGGDMAATPAADMAPSSPEAGGAAGVPPFFLESLLAGGTSVPPGMTVQIVVDLPPGEWVAWGDQPESSQTPVVFEATGEMPADLPEPESSATLTMGEYVIEVTEGAITTGPQVLKIENIGAQPHFVFGTSGPEGMTAADIEAILQADMTGTPAATDIDPNTDFVDLFSTGTQSNGTAMWIAVEDVPAGPMALLCFFPDITDGLPHAYHGMFAVVEVAE